MTKHEESKENIEDAEVIEERVFEKEEQTSTDKEDNSSTNKSNDQSSQEEKDNPKGKNVLEEFGEQIGKFATSTIDTLKKGVDKALVSRNTVLTIRVTDEANRKLSMLVETGLFKSRSESASFLIEEGIKQQEELFKKIGTKMDEIERLRADLKNIVSEEFKTDSDES